jgi:hypothetical protein
VIGREVKGPNSGVCVVRGKIVKETLKKLSTGREPHLEAIRGGKDGNRITKEMR